MKIPRPLFGTLLEKLFCEKLESFLLEWKEDESKEKLLKLIQLFLYQSIIICYCDRIVRISHLYRGSHEVMNEVMVSKKKLKVIRVQQYKFSMSLKGVSFLLIK